MWRCREVGTGSVRLVATRRVTTAGDAGVIDYDRTEGLAGSVAETAILIRRWMRRRCINFTSRKTTVMAGITPLTSDLVLGMRKIARYKARGQMAHTTIFAGRHMGPMFTPGNNTIVTGGAVVRVKNILMIKFGTHKGCRVMAGRAILFLTINDRHG